MYSKTTNNIRIDVEPTYLESESSPRGGHYVWAYHVRIENLGGETVQLLNRHWRIMDGLGRTIEVKGPGVIGEQPVLHPGDHFEYTSGTPLNTPSGIMQGSYEMLSKDGKNFEVDIPLFSLDSPEQMARPN